MTVPYRILSLLLCLLVAGPMSLPAWAVARPENRVGEIFSSPLKSAPTDRDQTLEPRGENPGCGYDFASGVCKYLYASANPVNRIDPSGHADFNIASITTTVGIIGIQASQYISRVPAMAATAFRSGGQALGSFFNQFGPMVQNFARQTIELIPRIQAVEEPVLQGLSRRPDFLLRVGDAMRALEGKYQLPSAGEALTRMGSQIQQFSQWASQGTGREVVVWALKSPENVTKAEQAVLQAAGNPQGVRFVYGVEGLFQYLSQWADF